jgi:hypothetical protein
VLTLLGYLAQHQGDDAGARARYVAALRQQGMGLLPLRAVQALSGLALLAAAQGQAEQCLCLAAASAALARATGVRSFIPEPATVDEAVQAARRALGARAEGVWQAGYAMTEEQAIANALQEETDLN